MRNCLKTKGRAALNGEAQCQSLEAGCRSGSEATGCLDGQCFVEGRLVNLHRNLPARHSFASIVGLLRKDHSGDNERRIERETYRYRNLLARAGSPPLLGLDFDTLARTASSIDAISKEAFPAEVRIPFVIEKLCMHTSLRRCTPRYSR